METRVSVSEKKEFIRWVLKNNQMKRRECVWILNYLISHENVLKSTIFVEDGGHYCPRAMIMSATNTGGIPFRFYKGSIMTADAEKSFHDIRLNSEEPLYIQINIADMNRIEYLNGIEENPYMPYTPNNEVEEMLDGVLLDLRRSEILDGIDKALDEKDEEKFLELTNKLKRY